MQLLAWLLHSDKQLDAAEEAASQTISLLPDEGEQFLVCQCYHLLGDIYYSKGEIEKAINHFKTALRFASSSNWHDEQFWNHYSLAKLFSKRGRLDNAHVHVEHAKSHAINDPYLLGRATQLQAQFWFTQSKFEEAKSGALCAADMFEKLGAVKELKSCRALLKDIRKKRKKLAVSSKLDSNGKPKNDTTSYIY